MVQKKESERYTYAREQGPVALTKEQQSGIDGP